MAKRISRKDAPRKLAVEAARIAHDNNCTDLLVLDLRGISPITDYFVICTGTSGRQMHSVAADVAEYGKSIGQKVWQVAGLETGQWIVMDFVDVVVHIFSETHRKYYDLELIWGEARKVRWQRRAAKRPKQER
ncbi:MAG: ribosome silencing factor [Planctomycetota bacterium]|nr:ribosome silencing factor [Planctomycetota bacterium]